MALTVSDLNHLHDPFLSTHYGYTQIVNKPSHLGAILNKVWTNLAHVYDNPVLVSELGAFDHCMVLFSPPMYPALDPGAVSCQGQFEYFSLTVNSNAVFHTKQ